MNVCFPDAISNSYMLQRKRLQCLLQCLDDKFLAYSLLLTDKLYYTVNMHVRVYSMRTSIY